MVNKFECLLALLLLLLLPLFFLFGPPVLEENNYAERSALSTPMLFAFVLPPTSVCIPTTTLLDACKRKKPKDKKNRESKNFERAGGVVYACPPHPFFFSFFFIFVLSVNNESALIR